MGGVVGSLSVRLFSESFFYQFDLDTGAAKIHTCAHAHIRPHTCKYLGAKVACMSGNQVTPPPLLWAPLLLSSFYPIFFILFIPLTVSCPHLSRIYTLRGVAEASCRSLTCISSKIQPHTLGAEITSGDHQLWLVNLGCSRFLPHVYDAVRDCW